MVSWRYWVSEHRNDKVYIWLKVRGGLHMKGQSSYKTLKFKNKLRKPVGKILRRI